MKHWTLHFDGACAPVNPGGVGCWAWILDMDDGCLHRNDRTGHGCLTPAPWVTNNVAEYWALGCGIRAVERLAETHGRPDKLTAVGDSNLVIEQMAGRWTCKTAHLSLLRDRINAVLFRIGGGLTPDWCWVPRAENAEADALTCQAYLEFTGQPMPDMRRPRRKDGGT